MAASQREIVPVVEMRGVSKVYRSGSSARTVEVHALVGVDLTIYPGEYVALMGPSGSGKSTLMHIIGLLDTPTEGEYRLGGEPVRGLSEAQLARIRNQRVGFVFQAFFLLPRLTALHNVALPLVYRGLSSAERLKRAKEALESVGLGDRLDHLPSELSGGQKQRVAIARALVQEPDLLLADEPTGNLDSRSSHEIMELFEALHRQGKTIVVVTHEPDVAARAQRIVRLRDGRVADGG
jgi:putative ABC transport system ATP-binding protein